MQSKKEQLAIDLHDKLFNVYDKIHKVHSKQMFDEKLTASQFSVLKTLFDYGPSSLKKISQKLLVTGANITCVIDNLEKEGYVKRINSKEDRRVIIAELTSIGKSKVEAILPKYYDKINSLLSVLSEQEQKELMKLLNKLY